MVYKDKSSFYSQGSKMINSSTEDTKRHSEEKTAFLRSSIARSPLTEESRCYSEYKIWLL